MRTAGRLVETLRGEEEGHARPLPGLVIAAVGVVLLGIGASGDTGWLAIVGGGGAAVGFLAWEVLRHTSIDYDVYRRLEELERRK